MTKDVEASVKDAMVADPFATPSKYIVTRSLESLTTA